MTLCNFVALTLSFALLKSDDCGKISCEPVKGYLFLKEYRLPFKEGKQEFEFSYVLIKGNEYVFSIHTAGSTEVPAFELLNTGRRIVVPKLSHGARERRISFKCNATGTYYFNLSDNTGCAALWLGFKRS